MSFLLKWLGLRVEKPAALSVRPSRAFVLDDHADAVFERAMAGLDRAVGAQVQSADRERGVIEASFGLMFSERIAIFIRTIDAERTEVVLESRRIAGATLPQRMDVLERLEQFIKTGA